MSHRGRCVFQIEEITFKNYYTAYVTVRLLRRSPGQETPAKWCTALRDLPLMDNPHTERGSQDYYSIHRTQVSCSVCVCRPLHNYVLFHETVIDKDVSF